MATMRFTTRIARDVETVWKAISLPDALADWFTGVISSETHNNIRTVRGGSDGNIGEVKDIIITNDSELRRFQYRVAEAEGHLATIDVLEIGDNDTLVIYSVEVGSDDFVDAWKPYMESGVQGLKRYLEGGR